MAAPRFVFSRIGEHLECTRCKLTRPVAYLSSMRRIAYVTDLHFNEQFPARYKVDGKRNWLTTINDIQKEKISHIIIGGDIGDASAHPWFFNSLKAFSFQLTLGNHDHYNEVVKQTPLATSGNGEHYFFEEDEIFKYLFLDTSAESISQPQLQWLQAELITEKKVVLFLHHPVLPVATAVDQKYPLQNRADVMACLLKSGRAMTLFCGHYHLADEQTEGNIRQVISPAVSFQLPKSSSEVVVDGSAFGYRIIQFNRDGSLETSVKMFKSEAPQEDADPATEA